MAEDSTPPIPPQTEAPRYAPQVVQPQKLKRATRKTRQGTVRRDASKAPSAPAEPKTPRHWKCSNCNRLWVETTCHEPPRRTLIHCRHRLAVHKRISARSHWAPLRVSSRARGMDVRQPRLSWQIRSERRGERQTAYQVLVASSEGGLRHNRGDLWDTGQVASDQSIQVTYGGQALTSWMRCYWKVRAWNRNGKVSSWSAPADWQDARRYRPGRW